MPVDIDHLKELQRKWKECQPLTATQNERLWLKLRLEWNYHSNHIEGNTLTYGETAEFLLHDQVSGHHSAREYDEMKGHDLAIKLVQDLAAGSEDITETDIRNLNQILLKEPFYRDAITPDGKPTRKLITPGRYKEEPNSVRTATGELFEYASPLDVSPRMTRLLETVRRCPQQDSLEFLATLAITHHEFTLIHPFDDGNGRGARLLTNYLLLRKGLLPLVISSDKKSDYLSALRQADAGDHGPLTQFFSENLARTLGLGIKAAKGESLEDPSDIDKEIALFVREQKAQKKEVVKKDKESISNLLSNGIQPLIKRLEEKTSPIAEMFESRDFIFSSNVRVPNARGLSVSWQDALRALIDSLPKKIPQQISVRFSFRGYLGEANHPFSLMHDLHVQLHDYEFAIYLNGVGQSRLYSTGLPNETIDQIVNEYLKKLLQEIKNKSAQK